jgi:hypothetical protein
MFATGINDTGGKQWDYIRLQIPLSELEGKNVYKYILTLLSTGVPKKLLKFF